MYIPSRPKSAPQSLRSLTLYLSNIFKLDIIWFLQSKKYGKFITRAGVWTEKSKEWISKKNENLFTYYDLDNEGYRTASGDVILNERKDN